MVALNPRLSVTHNGHNTWKLHISHVQLNDSGSYMCQVNTDPMRSQVCELIRDEWVKQGVNGLGGFRMQLKFLGAIGILGLN